MRSPRLALLAPALLAFAAAPAAARPVTVGVQLGATNSRVEAEAGQEASDTSGLYGRLGLSPRTAVQLELGRIGTDASGAAVRQVTGLFVLDLGRATGLAPTLFAGVGVDHITSPWATMNAYRLELGAGLEYRAAGGLTIGADLRVGDRQFPEQVYAQPVYDGAPRGGAPLDPIATSSASSTDYRAARLYVGVRF